MAVMWRCPECETMNTEDKCIICGCSKPKTMNNTSRPNIVQEQLKISNSNQESLKSVQNSKLYKIDNQQDSINSAKTHTSNRKKKNKKIPIIIVSCVTVIFIACVSLGVIKNYVDITDKREAGLPDITIMTTVETTAPVSEEETTTTVVPESVTESVVEENMVVMPSLVKQDFMEATKILDELGLQYKITYSDKKYVDVGENCVYSQNPATGKEIKKDTVVEIGISTYKSGKNQLPTNKISVSSDTSEYTKEWNETEFYETLYIKTQCYSITAAIVGADPVKRYLIGTKINVIASTDTGYYKLADGSFIHFDYVTNQKLETKDEEGIIVINGSRYLTESTFLYLSGEVLTDEEFNVILTMSNLTELVIMNCQISDISYLGKLTNLKKLVLYDIQISDISSLSGLTNLTSLDISNNQISDISPLGKLTNLEKLELMHNQISDISSLSRLTNLTSLDMADNQISDISSLKHMTNLSYLNLTHNKINDISPLKGLTNLKQINMQSNNIIDISALSGLSSLTSLNLCNNQVSDIGQLSELINVTGLYLDGNQISDINPLSNLKKLINLSLGLNPIDDLSVLYGLTELGTLDLTQDQINDVDLNELKKTLPMCRITISESIIFAV